jgi:hypothetical protein
MKTTGLPTPSAERQELAVGMQEKSAEMLLAMRRMNDS